MIVAPLMGPIMATTAAVIMGSRRRALRAIALVVAGIVTVIISSFLLSYTLGSCIFRTDVKNAVSYRHDRSTHRNHRTA
jgi:uncharacterized membrane protein